MQPTQSEMRRYDLQKLEIQGLLSTLTEKGTVF